jgi:hypothetical protein
MKHPKNVAAVLAWIREHRPDLTPQYNQIFSLRIPPDSRMEAFAGLVLMGFEAGRVFEREHPDVESGIGY